MNTIVVSMSTWIEFSLTTCQAILDKKHNSHVYKSKNSSRCSHLSNWLCNASKWIPTSLFIVLLFFLDWLVHSLILVDTNAADTFSVAGLTTCNGPACGAVQVLIGIWREWNGHSRICFFRFFLGVLFWELWSWIIYIPLRPIAYKMLTSIRLSDYNIS